MQSKEMSVLGDGVELQFKVTLTCTSEWDKKKIILYIF